MASWIGSALRRYLPTHVERPLGTLARVIKSREPAAISAIAQAIGGVAASPIDGLLSVIENAPSGAETVPGLPIVFVCGPSRSGTSIVGQVLIRQLPVSYFSNLTALFPKAPITASRLLSFAVRNDRVRFETYYGRSRGLSGPNDALALWDRWFGNDRTVVPPSPGPLEMRSMQRFFGAWQAHDPRPLVAKNNQLYIYGADVAAALPTATFICMQRDPVFHAQSQLIARRAMLGREDRPYGSATSDYWQSTRPDRPAEDACVLVASYRHQVRRTQQRIGKHRFWVISYEQFCRRPNELLERLATEVLHTSFSPLDPKVNALESSSRRVLDDRTFSTIQRTCDELGLLSAESPYFS